MNTLITTIKYSFFTLFLLSNLHIITIDTILRSPKQLRYDLIIRARSNNFKRDPRLQKKNGKKNKLYIQQLLKFRTYQLEDISKIKVTLNHRLKIALCNNPNQAQLQTACNIINKLQSVLLKERNVLKDMLALKQSQKFLK